MPGTDHSDPSGLFGEWIGEPLTAGSSINLSDTTRADELVDQSCAVGQPCFRRDPITDWASQLDANVTGSSTSRRRGRARGQEVKWSTTSDDTEARDDG